MNAVILSVILMITLSMIRIPIVLALIISAIIGGLVAGLSMPDIVSAFNSGLGNGATVALAYATLGAFAVALARTGLAHKLSQPLISNLTLQNQSHAEKKLKWLLIFLYTSLILMGFIAETIIPIHIAFIPLVVPPLLMLFNRLQLDRRAVACALTFSLIIMYLTVPIGFGGIFLNDILIANINRHGAELGLNITLSQTIKAMTLPALGMCFGLIVALTLSYKKKRLYQQQTSETQTTMLVQPLKKWQIYTTIMAIFLALCTQLYTGSMIFSGLIGFSILSISGIIKRSEQDQLFTQGMRLMVQVGFIMIAAAGFAEVMNATGSLPRLVEHSVALIGERKALAALIMLLVGLIITMGIGSSFSTVPIIVSIYVPLCMAFNFSPLATIALIGTAAALGDAGSPASDSTLGPTSGLNADGQHNHIWDTVVPTFLHFNLPLIIFGWLAAILF